MHHLGIRHIVACICAKPRNSAFFYHSPMLDMLRLTGKRQPERLDQNMQVLHGIVFQLEDIV
jgi:hypothetical protein